MTVNPSNLPALSIVVPSFNQGAFLNETLDSIIDQQYPRLELIVVDGGSKDSSLQIIRAHEADIACWVSEPDKGQVDAINKGLRFATGEWVGWQNSDDIYAQGTFTSFVEQVAKHPKADLITGDLSLIAEDGTVLREVHYVKPTYNALRAEGMIVANQSSFWRRAVHERIGYLDERYECSFDYEWFLRLTREVEAYHVNKVWGGLRLHAGAKSHLSVRQFAEENARILHGREMPNWMLRYYQLRRTLLLLKYGDFRYICQGLVKRLRAHTG